MLNGFSGRPATTYLTKTEAAHSNAVGAGKKTPAGAPPGPNAKHFPFEPGEAKGGGFVTGYGNSSNIVSDQREYEEISRMISHADDRMGECLYRAALEIEALCQSAYRLPWATPRCLDISNSVKTSMGEFRSLTEEATQQMGSYAREIEEIG